VDVIAAAWRVPGVFGQDGKVGDSSCAELVYGIFHIGVYGSGSRIQVDLFLSGIFREKWGQLLDFTSGEVHVTGTTKKEFTVASYHQVHGVFAQGAGLRCGITGERAVSGNAAHVNGCQRRHEPEKERYHDSYEGPEI